MEVRSERQTARFLCWYFPPSISTSLFPTVRLELPELARWQGMAAATRNANTVKRLKFLLFGYRRPRDIAKPSLSPLERKVMKKVWKSSEVSVGDVYLHLGESVPYTTLMTVMDRLYKQDLLLRRKRRQAFLYSPALSREQLERAVRKGIIDSLLVSDEDVDSVLSCIVDRVSKRNPELLEEFALLVKQKKQALRRKDSVRMGDNHASPMRHQAST